MDKQHIFDEIKRIAKDNDSKPPGQERFETETGIKRSDWYPHHWLRWGDALKEAGLTPNKFKTAYDQNMLLEVLVGLTRELGHFPLHGEIRRKAKQDPTFPSHTVFDRLGGKQKLVSLLVEYCKAHSGFDDILDICAGVSNAETRSAKTDRESANQVVIGFVYLIKFGRHHKIGRTNAIGRRERELAIQLPEKANTVHVIKTDDPIGIEAYWHKRFESKRGNGEWFDLTSDDIKAFKRRKFM